MSLVGSLKLEAEEKNIKIPSFIRREEKTLEDNTGYKQGQRSIDWDAFGISLRSPQRKYQNAQYAPSQVIHLYSLNHLITVNIEE